MKSTGALLGICLLALLTGCATTITSVTLAPVEVEEAQEPAPRAVEPAVPESLERVILASFEPGSCDFAELDDVPIEPECGWLSTPMLGTTGVDIELPVMIFRATGSDPVPDPIFYLHGGPAGALVEYAAFQYETIVAPFVDDRDVVLFDQRGSGLSKPSLICEPAQNFWSDPTEDDDFEFIERRARTCAWRLRNDDVALKEFNKERSADDVMVLARELGYDQINLVGTSWGGLLATTIMTEHPDLVRAAILNSPLSYQTDLSGSMPASYFEALTAVQAACDQDPPCAERHGDIVARFSRLVDELDRNPLEMTLITEPWFSTDDYELPVELTGEELVHLLFGLLYSPEAIASIPDLLLDLEAGDTRLVTRFSSVYGWGWGFDFGFLTYMCTDIVPPSSLAAVEAQQIGQAAFDRIDDVPDGRGPTAPLLCKAMKVEPPPPDAPPQAPTQPALVFSGELDPITAYSTGESLAAAIPRGTFVGFEDLSHGALQDVCASSIAVQFLDEPTEPVDARCSLDRHPLPIADAALSLHEPNAGITLGTYDYFLDGRQISVTIPEGYEREWFDDGATWWREDAPYDLTAIAVFDSNEERTAADEVEAWAKNIDAFEVGDAAPMTFDGAEWTRREYLSPYNLSLVTIVRNDDEIAMLLQAYPEELAQLELYLQPAPGLGEGYTPQ